MNSLMRWCVELARRSKIVVCTVALGVAAVALPVRADRVDEELLRHSTELLRHARERGYRNVGVLKFRVQKGDKAPGFDVGRLNMDMATRLENALILASPDSEPIGITRSASQVAAAQNHLANYSNAGGRKALFQNRYPLAWGDSTVEVDAFLTGIVKVSADMRQTSVTVEAFDKETLRMEQLTAFTVPTDRNLLADMNESFVLAKRSLRSRGDDPDQDAVEDAAKRNSGEQEPGPDFNFAIYYDGKPQQETGDQYSPGELGVPSPEVGQEVHFQFSCSERIAIVLRVNGMNTLYKQEQGEPQELSKWVLAPNVKYTVRGFYTDLQHVEKFRVLSEEDSAAWPLLDNRKRGLIEIDFFREGEASESSENPQITSRGIGLRRVPDQRPDSVEDAQAAIRRLANAQTRGRGIIVEGEAADANLEETTFKNPQWFGHQVIRYYRP